MEVCAASDVLFSSFCPINDAITTLAPIDNPTNELTSKLMIGPFAPTAANGQMS